MPFVIPSSSSAAAINTTLVSDIVNTTERDLNDRFAIAPAVDLLVDYTNRIQQMILGERTGKWDWMISSPKRFLTVRGQPNYWIGPAGGNPAGVIDTLLNLSDIREILNSKVYINGTWKNLYPAGDRISVGNRNPDGTYREDNPVQWASSSRRNAPLIELYPAPNTGYAYEMVPPSPATTVDSSGTLPARTYFIKITFIDEAGGESLPSNTAERWVAANKIVSVVSPVLPIDMSSNGIGFVSYRVYASETQGVETLQATITLGTDWQETAGSGLSTSGALAPTTSTLAPLNGHLIEFQYYKKHTTLTAVGDTLQIPSDYEDVVQAGVNMLGAQFLHRNNIVQDALPEVQFWLGLYEKGLARMKSDQPRPLEFIRPDPATVSFSGMGNWRAF